MDIQTIIALIFFIPIGMIALGSFISLICLSFMYSEEWLVNRKAIENKTLPEVGPGPSQNLY